MSEFFNKKGVASDYYHKLRPNKDCVHDEFMCRAKTVLVATVAFGMGIDNHHVRHVLHFRAPKTMECYVQEYMRFRDLNAELLCVAASFLLDYEVFGETGFYDAETLAKNKTGRKS